MKLQKKPFFKDIEGILVFDKIQFGWIISSREFLPNNYTAYKNKIGLYYSRGENIALGNDVVLACLIQRLGKRRLDLLDKILKKMEDK